MPRGRPKKSRLEVARGDMKVMGLKYEDAQNRVKWKSWMKGKTG